MKALSLEIESSDDVEELSNILMRLLSIDGIPAPFIVIHNVPNDFQKLDLVNTD